MPHPRFSSQEIGERGQELYEKKIRFLVESVENIGKIVSIDIETGEYAISDTVLNSSDTLLAKNPNAALFGVRIGYNAVYAVGGMIRVTTLS